MPRGDVARRLRIAQGILDLLVVGWFLHLGCETRHGTLARIERKSLPKSRRDGAGSHGVRLPSRYAMLWFDDAPEAMVGYAFPQVLHGARAGDRVTVTVRPDCGYIRRLRNHDRPRRWWQF